VALLVTLLVCSGAVIGVPIAWRALWTGPSASAPAGPAEPSSRTPQPNPADIDWVDVDRGVVSITAPGLVPLAGPTEVEVGAFQIARTEVTVGQYRLCVEAGKCSAPGTDDERCNWGQPDRDDHPVNCVNAYQALEFARWQGGCEEGPDGCARGRLPTGAEWQLAAGRGGEWSYPEAAADAWTECITRGIIARGTCVVGSGNANDAGLLDMNGNVSEWTLDCLVPDDGAPTTSYSWDARRCEPSQQRGSSWRWSDGNVELPPSTRATALPARHSASSGFRLARDLPG